MAQKHSLTTIKLLVAALVLATVATTLSEAGIYELRRKLSGFRHGGGHGYSGGAAASAAATVGGGRPHGSRHRRPAYNGYYAQPTVTQHHHQAAPVYAAPPQQHYAYPSPPTSHYTYSAPAPTRVHHQYAPAPSSGAASSAAAAAGSGGAAASSAAAGSSGHGGQMGASGAAASSAAAVGGQNGNSHVTEEELYNEHYEEPETENTYATQTGTYLNDGAGRESSSYVRATENVENHEDGKEDDNHYYNANSYAKTYDENKHEAYNNADEDVLHTPNVYRSKKSSTNFVSDLNKARRESGSGVLAHDRHSASYNKNLRKFKENVDQRYNREGAGVNEASAYATAEDHEDEDIEHIDSDGLGTFVGVDGSVHPRHPGFVNNLAGGGAAASGVASSDGNGQGVATSSAAAGRNAAASGAAAAGRR